MKTKHNLVFATNNLHKLEEIKKLLGDRYNILSLSDIGFSGDIPEDADNLVDNALQKVKFIYDKYNCNCFADDTGLEVDALGGEPGVYSARYAGEPADSKRNLEKLMKNMKNVSNRVARFRTVIALIFDKKEYIFHGVAEGEITTEKRGKEGFGYDPVFQPEGYNQTFAEMPLEMKNPISHRGKASAELLKFLKK